MTRNPILWVLILSASLKPSESHGPEFEEGEHYEVVRPVRLHTVRKRHAEYHRPETLTYAMTVSGQDIEMQLERNNELLTKDYSETYYQEDGTRVTTVPKDIEADSTVRQRESVIQLSGDEVEEGRTLEQESENSEEEMPALEESEQGDCDSTYCP